MFRSFSFVIFSLFASFTVADTAENPESSQTLKTETSYRSLNLDTVTVVSHRNANQYNIAGITLHDLPLNSTVINREEIERIRFIDPDELLDRIPGETQVRNLRIPNGGKSYTLAFADMMPVESPYEGATERFDRVNTHDIERVEVYKGPVSALFPNNLLGGAINVVSRIPKNTSETELWYERGSYQRMRLGTNSSGAIIKDKLYYVIDANRRKFSGMRKQGKDNKDQISSKITYQIDTNKKLDFRAEYFNEDTVVRKGLTAEQIKADQRQAGGLQSSQDLTQKTASMAYEQQFNWGLIQFHSLVRNKKSIGLSRFRGPQDSSVTSKQLKFLLRYDFNKQNITLGSSYYGDDQSVKQYGRKDTQLKEDYTEKEQALNVSAFFIQHQIKATDRLTITTGLRYEGIHSESKEEKQEKQEADFKKGAPKFGLTYPFNDSNQLWVGAGQGFYVPQLSHLYGRHGNPDLSPEEANHIEVGLRGSTNSWSYNTAYYHQNITNYLVTQEFIDKGVEIEKTTNAGEVTIKGIESVIEYAPADSFWRIALTHTCARNTYIKFNSSKGDFSGNDLSRSPKHHGNLRFALLPVYNLIMELEADMYSSYYSDDNNTQEGKFTRGERIHFRINYNHKAWGLWFNANNLTDTVEDRATYRVRKGVGKMHFRTAEGRHFVAGLSYRF